MCGLLKYFKKSLQYLVCLLKAHFNEIEILRYTISRWHISFFFRVMEKRAGSEEAGVHGCPSDEADAGYADICKGCPGQSLCQAQAGHDPMQEAIDVRMKAIKHKILVLSGKGGVGKSSITSNLAIGLSKLHGKKTAILDTDICGPSIAKLLSVQDQSVINTEYGWKPLMSPHAGVKVMTVASLIDSENNSIIFRGPRKTQLVKQLMKDTFWGRLDYLIVDTPPGTSDEHLSVIKSLENMKADGAIIVTTPQQMALSTIRKEINFCRTMKIKIIGLVENMSSYTCPCCKEISEIFPAGGISKLCQDYGLAYLGNIPMDQDLVRCCEIGGNIFTDNPSSPGTCSVANVVRTVLDLLH